MWVLEVRKQHRFRLTVSDRIKFFGRKSAQVATSEFQRCSPRGHVTVESSKSTAAVVLSGLTPERRSRHVSFRRRVCSKYLNEQRLYLKKYKIFFSKNSISYFSLLTYFPHLLTTFSKDVRLSGPQHFFPEGSPTQVLAKNVFFNSRLVDFRIGF